MAPLLSRRIGLTPPSATMSNQSAFLTRAKKLGASSLNRLKKVGATLLPQSRVSVWIFLRLLGVVNVIAFASLYVQLDGLIGSNGIAPAADFLDLVKFRHSKDYASLLPTLCWLNDSDAFLRGLCLLGIVAGLCVTIGFAPWLFIFTCWLSYLSLSQVGQSFFSFQWDGLLLEVNACALFLIPLTSLRLRGTRHTRYHRVGLMILLLLLFKLMFSSGMVKISSEDPTWANLSAMEYHYQTQPLPLATAWYAHKISPQLLKASCLGMFIIELLFPFCIFLPRLFRLVGCIGLVLLQLLIMGSGNYCFFNLLTVALCILMIEDKTWARIPLIGKRMEGAKTFEPTPKRTIVRRCIHWPLAAVVSLLMVAQTAASIDRNNGLHRSLGFLTKAMAPYRTFNGYGLFAIMTTQRPEIILQGSNDGVTWIDYTFKYKPCDPGQRPRLVAPHQPRLDWQFWFASFSWAEPQPWTSQPWLFPFVERLLENQPVVTDLLAENPFPDKPPKFIRAMTYDYVYTTAAERKETGHWWKRTLLREYFPPLSFRQ